MNCHEMKWRMTGKSIEEKKAADKAFRLFMKRMKERLKPYGFVGNGTSNLIRLNSLGFFENIYFQKDMYGRKYLTVNLSIYPIYVKREFVTGLFGRRIGAFYSEIDQWFGYLDENEATESFHEVIGYIEKYVLPWFEGYQDKKQLLAALVKKAGSLNGEMETLSARNLAWYLGEDAIAKRCHELYMQHYLPSYREYPEKMDQYLKPVIDRDNRWREERLQDEIDFKTLNRKDYLKQCVWQVATVWRLSEKETQRYLKQLELEE